jgi:hypothetical protein
MPLTADTFVLLVKFAGNFAEYLTYRVNHSQRSKVFGTRNMPHYSSAG